MNRKVVLLNLTLLALLALLGWQLREHWVEARAEEAIVLGAKAETPAVALPPARPAPEAPVPADYIDVAQRTLFSKDRDPNVIIEPPPPPPPPPPEKPVPPLPAYHGQMALGEPSILLSLDGGQKAYRAGEQIGEFKIASFDRERIALEWDGKTIERDLAELRLVEQASAKRPPAPKQQAAAPPPRDTKTKIGGGSQSKDPRGHFAGGKYMCQPGETSPNGTVYEGFRKTEVVVLMGGTCTWEPIE